ncbi:hypothetical protein BGZ93_009679 [Podila epicladia]|nr:hypothetical protein BGZ93_009679 [Podila epicladia]
MEAIVSLFGSNSVAIQFEDCSTPTLLDLKHQLSDLYQIPIDQQRLQTAGGLPLSTGNDDEDDQVLLFGSHEHKEGHQQDIRYFGLTLRMAGGKGGFGSMLRAQGGRMSSQKGPSNTDACRDLSGRRIKTVKDAKNMAEYLRQQPEREKAKKESLKRKIEEKQELANRPTRKHRFEDTKFFDETEEQIEDVKNAVAAAIKESLKASPSSSNASGSGSRSDSEAVSPPSSGSDAKGKGKAKDVAPVKKPAAKSMSMWDDMSDYESSEEEGGEDEEEEEEEEEEEVVEKKSAPSVGTSKAKAKSTRSKK